MNDIQINLDAHEALHTMKALCDAVSKLNYQADAFNQSQDWDEAFLARDQAKTLEGVAKQLSKACWAEGMKAPFAFYQGSPSARQSGCVGR